MNLPAYNLCTFLGRFVRSQCIRQTVLHAGRAQREGPFILAVTHLSHLEPVVISLQMRRPVHWVARIEFYRHWLSNALLRLLGTVSVDRQGRPVRAIRRSVELLRQGKVVGIFPEGGVAQGQASAMRGGPIRLGACVIARRAGVPIVPVAVLGTERLNAVEPWLPAGRGRVWIAYGLPIYATQPGSRRQARLAMGRELSAAFQSLYRELLRAARLDDAQIP